jgi:hypothetical protein
MCVTVQARITDAQQLDDKGDNEGTICVHVQVKADELKETISCDILLIYILSKLSFI